jgi:hypothetical protein
MGVCSQCLPVQAASWIEYHNSGATLAYGRLVQLIDDTDRKAILSEREGRNKTNRASTNLKTICLSDGKNIMRELIAHTTRTSMKDMVE